MSFLDPRQWIMAIAFLGAAFLGIKFWEHRLVQQGFDAGYAKAEQVYKARDAKAQAEAAAKTARLQTAVDTARKEKAHEVSRITAQRDNDLERLRQRPERPAATASSDAGVGPGCTGAGLARPDAEFLVRYAADAAQLQATLNECRTAYESARSISLGDLSEVDDSIDTTAR